MELQTIMILILSLMLMMMSAWSFATFSRLSRASDTYSNDKEFESACKLTVVYVEGGKWSALGILILSGALLFFSSQQVYNAYK